MSAKDGDYGGRMSLVERLVYRTLRLLLLGLVKVYLRFEVVGAEHLPTDRPYILSPVHRSYLDMPLSALTTPRIMRYMGKETLWGNWLGSFFLTSMGGFPVHRGTVDRDALRACHAVLERDEPLVMFPEGTRRDGPIVQQELMHDGPAFMSGRAQVPIIPVGIGGTARAMPPGTSFVFPRKVVYVIGEPLDPPEQVNGRVPRRLIAEKTEELRVALQDLYDEAQIRAGA